MSTEKLTASAPNLAFSHMGLSVQDIARMEEFYTSVLGFTVTDRGAAAGLADTIRPASYRGTGRP